MRKGLLLMSAREIRQRCIAAGDMGVMRVRRQEAHLTAGAVATLEPTAPRTALHKSKGGCAHSGSWREQGAVLVQMRAL